VLGGANGSDISEEWLVWRLVLSRISTLTELDSSWSLDDLIRANLALTLQEYASGGEE